MTRLFASPYSEKKNPEPIRSRNTELASTRCGRTETYTLPPEELAFYRALQPPKRECEGAKWSNAALRRWRKY